MVGLTIESEKEYIKICRINYDIRIETDMKRDYINEKVNIVPKFMNTLEICI